ncbi:MAG: flavodoxin family protein [Novosphingobium sp.]|uniref:flavodoxin family protein n=1 Tax=Novosphingobium sp. TaxID=1874826 RepID=UPI003C7B2961
MKVTSNDPALLIVWHSRTGASRAMAAAAALGGGASARLIGAEAAGPDDFIAARGYLFVGPENLGGLSGAMKDMFDRCYYPLLGLIEGRAYATIIAAGSAGQGAEAQLDRIVTGWRLRRVTKGLIFNMQAQTPQEILAPKHIGNQVSEQCAQIGAAMAEGLEAGIF